MCQICTWVSVLTFKQYPQFSCAISLSLVFEGGTLPPRQFLSKQMPDRSVSVAESSWNVARPFAILTLRAVYMLSYQRSTVFLNNEI